jgi:hypothetical protein
MHGPRPRHASHRSRKYQLRVPYPTKFFRQGRAVRRAVVVQHEDEIRALRPEMWEQPVEVDAEGREERGC